MRSLPFECVRLADIRACRLWEICENLHRAELTVLERDGLVAEWVELTGENFGATCAENKGRGRPQSGVNNASRQLDIERTDVQRALKVASLSPEAQDKAREAGLDDNRSALLEAAKKPTAEGLCNNFYRHPEEAVLPPTGNIQAARQEIWGYPVRERQNERDLRVAIPKVSSERLFCSEEGYFSISRTRAKRRY